MLVKRRSDGVIFTVDHNFLMNSEFELLESSSAENKEPIREILDEIDDIKTVSRPASISVKSK